MRPPLLAIPAAGASSRMRGADKLLKRVDRLPLLRRQAMAALEVVRDVLVLVPGPDHARVRALDGLDLRVSPVADAIRGISATLHEAVRQLEPDQPLMILLPDVPGVGRAEIAAVLARFRAEAARLPVRASDPEGRPGTPLALPHAIAARLLLVEGDDGGREVLRGTDVALVHFEDDRATRDLDTPEDWANWLRDRQGDSETP